MINIIHIRFKREENSEWEKGYAITPDYDGQKGKHIIKYDGTVEELDIWDVKIEHYYGHIILQEGV